jgi:ribonuclease Y
MNEYNLLIGIGCFLAGLLIAYWIKSRVLTQRKKAAEEEAARLTQDSKTKAEALLREADLEVKDRLFKLKSEFDTETKDTRAELKKREARLMHKEENIDRKSEQLERRERKKAAGKNFRSDSGSGQRAAHSCHGK